MNKLLTTLVFMFFLSEPPPLFAQITHSATHITITGTETGDSLRAYIVANSLGTVVGRTTTVGRHIQPANGSTLTDSNCTWIFPDAWHYDMVSGHYATLFEMTDGVIIMSGTQKGHTTMLRGLIRLTNVQWRVEGNNGRTDFFNNNTSNFQFSNVQFIAAAGSGVLHLPTSGGLLEDINLIVPSSLSVQPDATNGSTLIARNWTLDARLSSIIGNGSRNRTAITRFENLTWDKPEWSIGYFLRGQTWVVVNPNKPANWTNYVSRTNGNSNMYEVHTHNVTIVDENNTPINGFTTQLRRSDATTLVYDEITAVNGDIPEQEVVTYDQAAGSNIFTQYSDFILTGIDYNHKLVTGVKSLQNGRIDEIILSQTDSNVTESTKATVDAYTSINNLDQLYDRAKSWKVTTANIEYPTIATLLVSVNGVELDLGSQNLVLDATATTPFAVDKITNTITIKPTSALVASTKFKSIKTMGTVSVANGASLEFGYEDVMGVYKYVELSNVNTPNTIMIQDNISGTPPTANVTGVLGTYKVHFLAPADASDIEVSVSSPDYSTYSENFPENDLNFIRNIDLTLLTQVVAETQIEMFNLTLKILQKEEAIFRALDLTNPPLTVNTTTGPRTGAPSVENQLAILEILNRVFLKVIANRRKLE
ncbi:hypothetical protein N9611_00880 [Flavobacteriaceae bacterium]|nr:hypothetical protein [Flavobacteriaceae bacterium]